MNIARSSNHTAHSARRSRRWILALTSTAVGIGCGAQANIWGTWTDPHEAAQGGGGPEALVGGAYPELSDPLGGGVVASGGAGGVSSSLASGPVASGPVASGPGPGDPDPNGAVCTEANQYSIATHEYDPGGVEEGFSRPGCSASTDGRGGLRVALQRLSTAVYRFLVRRGDGSELDPSTSLTLYVGEPSAGGPRCAADVPNVAKATVAGAIDARTLSLDLQVCPYEPCWCEGLSKIFWVAEPSPEMEVYRASPGVIITRDCLPAEGSCTEVGECPPEHPCP